MSYTSLNLEMEYERCILITVFDVFLLHRAISKLYPRRRQERNLILVLEIRDYGTVTEKYFELIYSMLTQKVSILNFYVLTSFGNSTISN